MEDLEGSTGCPASVRKTNRDGLRRAVGAGVVGHISQRDLADQDLANIEACGRTS